MTWATMTRLVAGRELREAFRRRSLWVVLAIVFVGATVAMILPDLLDSGSSRSEVAVTDASAYGPTSGFATSLQESASRLDMRVVLSSVASEARARQLVDDGDVDLAIVGDDPPTIVVRTGEDETLVALVRQALATNALTAQLEQSGLDQATIDQILTTPSVNVDEVAADESDRRAAAAILSLVLYLLLLLLMMQVATGVAIEKANRISEVLLAVVRPTSLFFGKVIGVGLVGLAGLAAGALPLVVKAVASGDLPAGLGPAIAGGLPWMLLGIALYLTTAGALGALVERQEEVGSVLAPLSFLLIGTYILAQSSSDGSLGAAMAIFPYTSPIVMPSRLALGDASAGEIVASLVVAIVTVVFVLRLGAAVYRRGIVHTGRRLRLGEVLRTS
jgi:ABC-2 type transport system permease protein